MCAKRDDAHIGSCAARFVRCPSSHRLSSSLASLGVDERLSKHVLSPAAASMSSSGAAAGAAAGDRSPKQRKLCTAHLQALKSDIGLCAAHHQPQVCWCSTCKRLCCKQCMVKGKHKSHRIDVDSQLEARAAVERPPIPPAAPPLRPQAAKGTDCSFTVGYVYIIQASCVDIYLRSSVGVNNGALLRNSEGVDKPLVLAKVGMVTLSEAVRSESELTFTADSTLQQTAAAASAAAAGAVAAAAHTSADDESDESKASQASDDEMHEDTFTAEHRMLLAALRLRWGQIRRAFGGSVRERKRSFNLPTTAKAFSEHFQQHRQPLTDLVALLRRDNDPDEDKQVTDASETEYAVVGELLRQIREARRMNTVRAETHSNERADRHSRVRRLRCNGDLPRACSARLLLLSCHPY